MKGATQADIESLQTALGVELPRAYKDWLLKFGADRDGPLVGSDCFIEHIVENTADLRELLTENGCADVLSESYVCFLMHQGYIAAWFENGTGRDDPYVWFFNEAETATPQMEGPFSQFIYRLTKEWGSGG